MTDIFLFNTLTGKKELFSPLKANEVSIYNCGPTVYNYAHIGNFRTYVFADLLRRVFEYNNYHVNQVMNITDVDDKTIRDSKKNGMSLSEFTRKYENIFKNELKELNIEEPTCMPRATESIDEMIDLIQQLIDKGFAYTTSDGVYFSIEKSKGYGELAGISVADLHAQAHGHRVKKDEYEKENAQDFALWKFHTEDDGDVFWDAPFGKGRPGWHIECSAMARKTLGDTIDIHTGARDLIFPHHTNEIAQSEAVTGKQFARVWMHASFLNVDSEKMAKSAGNFYTLPTLEEKGISPLVYRYWLLTAHYRTPLNFTDEFVLSAGVAFKKLQDHAIALYAEVKDGSADATADDKIIQSYESRFIEAINDDLNVSKGLALAWELLKDKEANAATKTEILFKFDEGVFGLGLKEKAASAYAVRGTDEEETPTEVRQIVEKRKEARENKDWAEADRLRAVIRERGYDVTDGPEGQTVKKIVL